MHSPAKTSFLSRKAALPLIRRWQKSGLTIGFTSGAFDLLHPGHVDYLTRAAKKCDRLVVAVNSDASIRAYKDPRRPIVGERDRLRVIAGLGAVSVAFLFKETDNRENILAIRPDFYIKGADYSMNNSGNSKNSNNPKPRLSSAPLLKNWGGKVIAIPLVHGKSTSALIDQVLSRYHDVLPRVVALNPKTPKHSLEATKKSPAVFLDRDGVINEEVEYLHDPRAFKFLPGVMAALRDFQTRGYKIIVVTNQAGIGLGYFSKADFFKVNKKMLSGFAAAGIVIHKVYYCPHGVATRCRCRKPGTGMIEQALLDENLDLKKSILIGDRLHDITCGKKMGMTAVLVRTGHGVEAEKSLIVNANSGYAPDYIADGILTAAKWFWLQRTLKTKKTHG